MPSTTQHSNILTLVETKRQQHLAVRKRLQSINQHAMAEMQMIRAETCDEVIEMIRNMPETSERSSPQSEDPSYDTYD